MQSNETLSQLEGKQIKIATILKKSGEQIQIPDPGICLIKSDTIFILSREGKRITIDKTNIKQRKINKQGETTEIITRDGEIFQVFRVVQEMVGGKEIIISIPPPPSYIPFAEVEKVMIEEYDPDKSVRSSLVWMLPILTFCALYIVPGLMNNK